MVGGREIRVGRGRRRQSWSSIWDASSVSQVDKCTTIKWKVLLPPLLMMMRMATRLSRKLKSETCRTSKTSTRIYVAQVLLGKLTQKRSSSKNRHQHQFHFNVSVLLVCTPHTHTRRRKKASWRREIMLINRSDTCRCTLLPNGHAPRNMHRILLSPTLPTCPTLHSCCGLWTRHPALPQPARGVYTSFTWNERQRFCNFFRERARKEKKNKLKVQNGWQRPAQQSC